MSEYLIPIGADLGPLINDIRQTRGEVTKLNEAVTISGDEAKRAFTEAGKASSTLFKATADSAKSAAELAKSFNAAGTSIDLYNAGAKETTVTQSQLNKELAKGIEAAKVQLATLKEGSKEYKKLSREIEAAEVGLRTLGNSSDGVNDKLAKLKKTFNENRAVLQNLAAQGLQNTKVYKELEKATGELDDTIKDVNESIALAGSDTRGLDNLIGSAQAITGAFAVAEGAAALFGEENENLQKALLRVNAALSILNGLQAIQTELKRKDSFVSRGAASAQALYATVVGTSTGAMKAFRIALASTGIGLLIIAIGALVTNFDKIKAKVLEIFPGLGTLADFFGRITTAVTDFVGITSEATRGLEAFGKATAAKNKESERLIKILEAQGGKEKEIYEQRRLNIRREILELNEREKVNKKLTEEELETRKDLFSDLQALDAGESKRLTDKTKEDQKTRDDAAKEQQQKQKEAREKQLAIDKDFADRTLAFDKQYRDLRIASIEDENARAIALENARFEDAKAAAQKVVDDFKGPEAQRLRLQEAANRTIEAESVNHYLNLIKIDADYSKERTEVIKNAAALTNQVLGSELDNELSSINEKYSKSIKDLEDRIAKAGSRNPDNEAVAALENLRLAKVVETNKAIQANREKTAEANSKTLKEEEKQYLSFAARINKAGVDLFKNAGLSDQEAESVFGSVKRVFGGIKDALTEAVEAQIEAKQRQVEALTDQIDEVQNELQREQDLQKAGYSNNVEAKTKEIEELKALRDKELAEEKRLRVERAKLESIDIAAATISQTVDLGAAAAKIFKAHAGIPFAGVALAAAAVAAMVGGFLSIKSKIKAAQDAVPKFRKGSDKFFDVLKGKPSHEGGGVSLVNEQTGERIAEFEGDEKLFVVNKGSSIKHEGLLQAINRDDFSTLDAGNGSIQKLLKEIGGIHTIEDAPGRVISQGREAQTAQIAGIAALANLSSLGKLDALIGVVNDFKKQQFEKASAIDFGDHVEVTKGLNKKIYRKQKANGNEPI